MTKETPQKYQHTSMGLRYFWMILLMLAALCAAPHVWAEGSISLFPANATGNRANLEWRTSSYGGGLLKRRTLLRVYANQGEYILVGSSAVGVTSGSTSGDVVIYRPSEISQSGGSPVGQETIPAYNAGTDFEASSQSGRGVITSRAQEIAGPNSVTGDANPNGYTPVYYVAPVTGAYWVVFTGPNGSNTDTDTTITGVIENGISTDSNGPTNFGATQGSSVTAWDVTVRPATTSGPSADAAGRLFCSYLTMNVGGNTRNLYSTLYAVTTDGYQYTVALHGLDPFGFVLYGSQTGLLDSDGASPLYHDVLAATNAVNQDQLTSIQGGCKLSLPQYPLFFQSQADPIILAAAGVSTSPVTPHISALGFTGTAGSNNSRVGTGGTFSFTSNTSAVYDITIVGSGGNLDPTLPTNRRLRGVLTHSGTNTVTWDGKDNSGSPFPVGTGYSVNASIHGGEYHFPLIDAENSPNGGPSFTLTNSPGGTAHPIGNTFGFYDDRGYTTLSGYNVTSSSTNGSGSASGVGQPLGGIDPPTVINSDPINGFDMSSAQRAYGQTGNNPTVNTNVANTGSFGDTKGLDLWTYFPSMPQASTLNVQGAPTLLLVKRITAVNGVSQTGFDNDPSSTDDTNANWPSPNTTYLRGVRSVASIKPGDELEYTIYFLDTNGPASNITLADVIPASTLFDTASYNGLTPTDGGAAGAASGISLALSASSLPTAPTFYLSNVAGDDRGTYDAASTKVTVVLSSLPAATGPGTPTGSYGFLRFRVRVQ